MTKPTLLTLAVSLALVLCPGSVLAQGESSNEQVVALQKVQPDGQMPDSSVEGDEAAPNEAAEESPSYSTQQYGNEIVSFGKSVHLKSNETAEVIVVLGGSAKVEGHVRDAIVAIGGDVDLSSKAESVVSIFGNVNLLPGGSAKEAVAVVGGVKVADGASVADVVSVGGQVTVAEGGKVTGEKVSLGLPGFNAPEWLQAWFRECLLKLRPLAPSVGWVWVVAAFIVLFYLIVALVFRGAVQACANEIVRRPATTLFVGVLAKMLIPIVILILIGTGIGLLVVPFVIAGGIVVGILGKAGFIESIGIGLGRAFGVEAMQKPIVAFLIGTIVLLLLFMVPIVGFLVYLLVGAWGLGAGLVATYGRMRRERPPRSGGNFAPANPPVSVASGAAGAQPASAWGNPSSSSASFVQSAETPLAASAAGSVEGGMQPGVGAAAPQTAPGAVPPIAAFRYAGFWERMGAALLDVILVSVVAGFAGGGNWWYAVALAYFAGMWTWRGTTIGGIVLGLKVVRPNGEPVSFAVALIRAITAAFSAIVLFLGFFWIVWDDDKQGWHDKVAGTFVIKAPKAAPLLCL